MPTGLGEEVRGGTNWSWGRSEGRYPLVLGKKWPTGLGEEVRLDAH